MMTRPVHQTEILQKGPLELCVFPDVCPVYDKAVAKNPQVQSKNAHNLFCQHT